MNDNQPDKVTIVARKQQARPKLSTITVEPCRLINGVESEPESS